MLKEPQKCRLEDEDSRQMTTGGRFRLKEKEVKKKEKKTGITTHSGQCTGSDRYLFFRPNTSILPPDIN